MLDVFLGQREVLHTAIHADETADLFVDMDEVGEPNKGVLLEKIINVLVPKILLLAIVLRLILVLLRFLSRIFVLALEFKIMLEGDVHQILERQLLIFQVIYQLRVDRRPLRLVIHETDSHRLF